MKISKSIVYIIIFQITLLLLMGCSSVNVMSDLERDEIVLKVEGIEVKYVHYDSGLESVKRGLIDRENYIKNSESEDTILEQLFEIEKKYGPSTIALANLILDYTMYAEALRIGITVSENEVQELIDIAKEAFSDEELTVPQSIKDFIERVGEENYWQMYLPEVYERFIYGNKLFHKIIAENRNDISPFQLSLVKEAEIEIINGDLFEGVTIVQALEFLEEYLVIWR